MTVHPLTNSYCTDICDDEKQLIYTRCSYIYPSGNQCSNPIPRYLDPPLCGGHCDSVEPPKLEEAEDSGVSDSRRKRDPSETEQAAAINSERTLPSHVLDCETCT